MGQHSSLTIFLLLLRIFLLLSHSHANPEREALEIGIGIGIGGSGGGSGGSGSGNTPSPPIGLQPCDFPNMKQYQAYLVIQRFKTTITCDPQRVTETWQGSNICGYRGFKCDTPPGPNGVRTIASVDFNGLTLAAPTVCGFIDQLPDLAIFHANSNNFSGSVPNLASLPFVYEVDVSNNKLTGPFPSAVANIKQLLFLDVRFNSFSGGVPPSVFNIKLAVLFINNNYFNSPLPYNVGSTTAKYLVLANNGFTGPIPRSIGDAANTLVEVLFLGNQLSGCLPYEIGFLKKATVFDAGNNFITGPIPKTFGCLAKVEQLNLARNRLYGEVPDVVCRLGNLANLSLSDNYFTSLGESCYSLLKKGNLDVKKNCIKGLPNQRSPEECSAFAWKPKYCPETPFQKFIPCEVPHHGPMGALPSSLQTKQGGGGGGGVGAGAVAGGNTIPSFHP